MLHRSQQVVASQCALYDGQSFVCFLNFCRVSPVSNADDKFVTIQIASAHVLAVCLISPFWLW